MLDFPVVAIPEMVEMLEKINGVLNDAQLFILDLHETYEIIFIKFSKLYLARKF